MGILLKTGLKLHIIASFFQNFPRGRHPVPPPVGGDTPPTPTPRWAAPNAAPLRGACEKRGHPIF